jgi:predicted PurR-regulated permease PerM
VLGIDTRAARATWTVLLVLLAVTLIWLLRSVLLLFFFAVLLAYLLSPLVDLVDRVTEKRVSRTIALAGVYLALLAMVGASAAWIGSRIVQEAAELASALPKLLGDPERLRQFPLPVWLEPYRDSAMKAIAERLEASVTHVMPLLTSAGRGLASAIGNLLHVILIPILSFFFLKEGAAIRERLLAQFADLRQRQMVEDVLADVHLLLAQFMRALVLLSLATFVTYWIALAILGVPYSLLLSLVAAVFEFIPVAGPLVATVCIFLVAIFSGGGASLLGIALFLILYRLFQDYVLQPHLMSQGVAIPPVAVIFAVLAGERIAGFAGMFLSIPALAILRIVYVRIRKAREQRVSAAVPS